MYALRLFLFLITLTAFLSGTGCSSDPEPSGDPRVDISISVDRELVEEGDTLTLVAEYQIPEDAEPMWLASWSIRLGSRGCEFVDRSKSTASVRFTDAGQYSVAFRLVWRVGEETYSEEVFYNVEVAPSVIENG